MPCRPARRGGTSRTTPHTRTRASKRVAGEACPSPYRPPGPGARTRTRATARTEPHSAPFPTSGHRARRAGTGSGRARGRGFSLSRPLWLRLRTAWPGVRARVGPRAAPARADGLARGRSACVLCALCARHRCRMSHGRCPAAARGTSRAGNSSLVAPPMPMERAWVPVVGSCRRSSTLGLCS